MRLLLSAFYNLINEGAAIVGTWADPCLGLRAHLICSQTRRLVVIHASEPLEGECA
jgi:hypothetical protein